VTIVHQIVSLLEIGTKEAFEDSTGNDERLPGTELGFMPKLGFGAFSINPEEQRVWKSHIIGKELDNIGELLSGVLELSRSGRPGASTSLEAAEERVKCLSQLQRRLRALSDRAGV
jgi:hypothetical protein